MRARHASTALAFLLAAGAAAAHVRLHHPGNKKALYWPSPGNIKLSIDPSGSADVPGVSDTMAIRLGMRDWNEDPGSKVQLVETSFTVTNKCVDWEDFSVHLVLFDELDCTGYFGGPSGTVALTPVLFNNNGQILDADVIFNGQDHDFTTSGTPGAFDVQDVGTHELGHLLGLDHSGWAGATMYPYVAENLISQRSLSLDDVHGLRHVSPQGPQGRINGQVRRLSDDSGVAGAHVHAVDANGRSAGAALADSNGNYSLRGLDAGDYTVHAEPLDDPVSEFNLQSGHTIEIDFEATAGPTVALGAGQTMTAPDFFVDADVILSLGTGFDDLPLAGEMGSVVAHTLTGVGLAAGSSLSASDPSVVIAPVLWTGNAVDFTVTTPGGEAPGHVDLIAQNVGGDRSVLVAAIEIVPPTPTVTNVAPPTGNNIGGTAVTITGTGFRPGARVILGEDIYEDGAAGGCTVVNSTTITLTSQASPTGTFDVVVMDETGVEGRDTAAFTVSVMPVLATRFPAAGDALGGTELILTGGNFQPGMTVRIDSIVQSNVVLEGTTVARVTTEGDAPGAYTLEVELPGGATATNAFSYVAQADPILLDVTPGSGSPAGGKLITLSGSGFTANTTVEFDADPLTGLGGTPAAAVTFIDASTVEVTTPAMSAGRVALLVSDGNQASVLPDAFSFAASGGGGGGGCYMVPADDMGGMGGPGGSRDALVSLVWLALAAAAILGYARLTRRRALVRSARTLAQL